METDKDSGRTTTVMDEMRAEAETRAQRIRDRETERRARRDRRYPLPPGVYLLVAVGLVVAIFVAGFPMAANVVVGLAVVFMLVSSYRAGERMMEQKAVQDGVPKSEYWKG